MFAGRPAVTFGLPLPRTGPDGAHGRKLRMSKSTGVWYWAKSQGGGPEGGVAAYYLKD